MFRNYLGSSFSLLGVMHFFVLPISGFSSGPFLLRHQRSELI